MLTPQVLASTGGSCTGRPQRAPLARPAPALKRQEPTRVLHSSPRRRQAEYASRHVEAEGLGSQ